MTFREITTEHRVTYDSEADAAYLYLAGSAGPGSAGRQVVVELEGVGEVILDVDVDGRLLGIEVTGAAALLPELLMRRFGVGR